MICSKCQTDVPAGRAFCPSCAAQVAPIPQQGLRPATAGRMDDVRQVELAHIPAVLHAPTTWTIAKGVFFGLLLWTVFSVVVAFVGFSVLLTLGQNALSN